MKKIIHNDDAFYTIAWSGFYKYEKYSANKILPELAGIVSIHSEERGSFFDMIYYGCWRDGCRVGLRKFLDKEYSRYTHIISNFNPDNIYYRYTIIDSSPHDMKDILYWLIRTYTPQFNNYEEFQDSKRYRNINVKEINLKDEDVVERIR